MSDDASLAELRETLAADGGLEEAQVRLLASADLLSLGVLADEARRRRHGQQATFVRVAEVAVDASAVETPGRAREIRVTGVPASVDAAETAVRAVAGQGVPVTGFALHDLMGLANGHAAEFARLLRVLGDAGLVAVSELTVDRTVDPESAVAVVADAGLAVSRLTIQDARGDSRLEWVRTVAGWSFPPKAVRAFAPLPRAESGATPESEPATGYDDVRQVALSRLLVDNIDSIQVDWALHGPKLAQVALTFGADDIDGVPAVDTDELGPRRTSVEDVRRNIRAASFTPVERDGGFESVTR
ncbi:MAG: hypothetical protein QF463_10010 [Vicinamibacterales bacterium]|nr:hypothetical protein [Acidobacteriota bacterium]MDP6371478.1 hypothetical protein [Vicinamibacterales bacterium]MDP6609389.1 hypothetical protein [Vicinamibacterales bacterium]HAK54234.1 hypothetical protein [Acidobacteriota bacterium]|tara:strand:+ start:1165 stop:2067 length:903 start_codon:yes stop_codon:yes gene_type:complete